MSTAKKQTRVKFARVLFSGTKNTEVVPITKVKFIKGTQIIPYLPDDKEDFVKLKYAYAVKIRECDDVCSEEHTHDQYKTVSILRLGGRYNHNRL